MAARITGTTPAILASASAGFLGAFAVEMLFVSPLLLLMGAMAGDDVLNTVLLALGGSLVVLAIAVAMAVTLIVDFRSVDDIVDRSLAIVLGAVLWFYMPLQGLEDRFLVVAGTVITGLALWTLAQFAFNSGRPLDEYEEVGLELVKA